MFKTLSCTALSRGFFFMPLAAGLALSGCGGDGSTPTPTPTSSNSPPAITGGNIDVSVAENTAAAVFTVNASDPDGDTLSYSLGGEDAAAFAIDASGAVRFLAPPNFDLPRDADRNNIYRFTMGVSDGKMSASVSARIAVENNREGIAVTRIMTGLVDPVGLSPTYASGREMAVALKNGSYIRFSGARAPGEAVPAPVDVLSANPDFVRLLDIAWGEASAYWSGPMLLYESTYAFEVLRPGQGQRREGNLTFGTNSAVEGKLFIGADGEAFASLGDPSGEFAQAPQTPVQDRFGRIFRLEPSCGASLLNLCANQIAGGVRQPGGFAQVNGLTAFADRGGSLQHEISLFALDVFTQTDNPLNFGWPFLEGISVLRSGAPSPLVTPSLVYPFGTGEREGAGIVMGVQYGGSIAGIAGHFVFADSSGAIFSIPANQLSRDSVRDMASIELRTLDFAPDAGAIDRVVEIAADAAGVLYILDADGEIFRVDPA